MTSEYSITEDAPGGDQVADSTPSEVEAEQAEPTASEVLAELRRMQSQFDRRFRPLEQDIPAKLRKVEEEQGNVRNYVLEQDKVLQQYLPAWEKWVEDLDPDDRKALKLQTETRTQAQLVRALAAQQAQGGAAPTTDRAGAQWQEQLKAEFEADDGGGDEIKAYAEAKGISYDRLYDHMSTNKLWPAPRAGQSPSNFMLQMVREAKKVADTLAADAKKREAPAVKAGAESRGGGSGTGRVSTQDLSAAALQGGDAWKKALAAAYTR